MISNPAPYISGAHIWVKYSKNSSNSHHFDTIFNKNDLKSKKADAFTPALCFYIISAKVCT
jgi:hypothetical protein